MKLKLSTLTLTLAAATQIAALSTVATLPLALIFQSGALALLILTAMAEARNA